VGAARQMDVPAGRDWHRAAFADPARLGLSVKNWVGDRLTWVYSCAAEQVNRSVKKLVPDAGIVEFKSLVANDGPNEVRQHIQVG